jgi:hypothetical protein
MNNAMISVSFDFFLFIPSISLLKDGIFDNKPDNPPDALVNIPLWK